MSELSTSSFDLTRPYPVTSQQISTFQKKGHIKLENLVNRQALDFYRPLIKQTVNQYNQEVRPLKERDTFGQAFLQTINLWQKNKAIKKFVTAKRFGKIAADLLKVDRVRLYLDQSFFKEAGGGPTPWHQDNNYMIELDPDKKITMWMPLVDIPETLGSLSFVSGSHNYKEITLKKALKEILNIENYGKLNAGDATFHDGWILHSANGNPLAIDREVMTITYYADPAKIVAPGTNEARQSHLKTYFPQRYEEEFADTWLNPLIYDRNID
ncbi:phytanoyl-CoA dioxygenase family protein [Fictibacillus sp. KIGAM418]|uniref:Phytanoyl-CoA dioxygenase family protein n=1 Tax=Fictibacillus marinisediminis TaxID=2878389 RepID=A0A9X1XEK1_9BACL|nr:phytanoyl-CoA dioxygenase family protein [Fictibacillus marinisediminis]MCK6259472.1 phytanoyl-CoA dioxygenase family protein [Fictibacillus marinisediminis]